MNRSVLTTFGQCLLALAIALTMAACGDNSGGEEEILIIPPAGDGSGETMGSGNASGNGGGDMIPGSNGGMTGGEAGGGNMPGDGPGEGNGMSGGGENGGQGSGMMGGGQTPGEPPANGGNGNSGTPNMPGGSGAAEGSLGAACASNDDCDSGFCVQDLPGGYCSSPCGDGVGDCGADGSCWNIGLPQMVCLLNCQDSSECRGDAGYICDSDDTCFPGGGSGGGNPGGGGGQGSGPGAAVGEIMADFSIINCGTGEPAGIRDYFTGERAAMFVLSAGWCTACDQWIPQILELLQNPQAEGLKVAFVLGENRARMQPDLRYCQQYARGKGIPLENMFMDHDGTNAFRTVFSNLDVYTDGQGRFGLPFNALVDPTNWEYIFADRGPGGDLNAGLQRLLQR